MTAWMSGARRVVIAFLLLLVSLTIAKAQDPPLWKETFSTKIESYDFTSIGSMLVQFKTGLLAIDPETGKHLWSRPEVTNHVAITGTPFCLAETPAGYRIINLDSGLDRWQFSTLGLSSVKGTVHLPSRGLILAYGETTESRHMLVAARYESGDVIWKQAELYSAPAIASKVHKIKYGRPLLDTDGTVVLDPSEDGLIRLDLASGRLLWRLGKMELDGEDDFTGLMAADGGIFATYGKKLLAIDDNAGKVMWTMKSKLPTPVFQMLSTPQGVIIRGAYNVDGNGKASWHPYVALLDSTTGATKWTTDKTDFKGRSSFLLEDNSLTIALEKGVASYDLSSGKVTASFSMTEFAGGEDPCCLERRKDGGLLISSSQNLRAFDKNGKPIYSVYLKAPGASFLAKLATTALQVAVGAASYAAASPGGVYYVPGNPVLTARFKATVDAEHLTYIFTEDSDPNAKPTKFRLARVDKETGKENARLYFTDRAPSYRLDPASGLVVVFDDGTLFAMRFPKSPSGTEFASGD